MDNPILDVFGRSSLAEGWTEEYRIVVRLNGRIVGEIVPKLPPRRTQYGPMSEPERAYAFGYRGAGIGGVTPFKAAFDAKATKRLVVRIMFNGDADAFGLAKLTRIRRHRRPARSPLELSLS